MTPDMFVNHQQVKECAQQQGGGSLPDVGSSLSALDADASLFHAGAAAFIPVDVAGPSVPILNLPPMPAPQPDPFWQQQQQQQQQQQHAPYALSPSFVAHQFPSLPSMQYGYGSLQPGFTVPPSHSIQPFPLYGYAAPNPYGAYWAQPPPTHSPSQLLPSPGLSMHLAAGPSTTSLSTAESVQRFTGSLSPELSSATSGTSLKSRRSSSDIRRDAADRARKRATEAGVTTAAVQTNIASLAGQVHLRKLAPSTHTMHSCAEGQLSAFLELVHPGVDPESFLSPQASPLSAETWKAFADYLATVTTSKTGGPAHQTTICGKLDIAFAMYARKIAPRASLPTGERKQMHHFLVPRYGLRTDAKLKSIPNTSDLKALLEVCWQEDGLFRSGRERLQLVMIVLIVLYSASRPGEIAPNANYFEQEDTMQWRDVEFRLTLRDDELYISANITIRNLKGRRFTAEAFKVATLYEEANGSRFADPVLPLLSLALLDDIFVEVHSIEEIEAVDRGALQNIPFLPIRMRDDRCALPVLRRIEQPSGKTTAVWTTSDSRPWPYTDANKLLKRVGKAAGFAEDVSFGQFRRQATNSMNISTVTVNDMRAASGHNPLSTAFASAYQSRRVAPDVQSLVLSREENRELSAALGDGMTRYNELPTTLKVSQLVEVDESLGEPLQVLLEDLQAVRSRMPKKLSAHYGTADGILYRSIDSKIKNLRAPARNAKLNEIRKTWMEQYSRDAFHPTTTTVLSEGSAHVAPSLPIASTSAAVMMPAIPTTSDASETGEAGSAARPQIYALAADEAREDVLAKQSHDSCSLGPQTWATMFSTDTVAHSTRCEIVKDLMMNWAEQPIFLPAFYDGEFMYPGELCYLCFTDISAKNAEQQAMHLHTCTKEAVEKSYSQKLATAITSESGFRCPHQSCSEDNSEVFADYVKLCAHVYLSHFRSKIQNRRSTKCAILSETGESCQHDVSGTTMMAHCEEIHGLILSRNEHITAKGTGTVKYCKQHASWLVGQAEMTAHLREHLSQENLDYLPEKGVRPGTCIFCFHNESLSVIHRCTEYDSLTDLAKEVGAHLLALNEQGGSKHRCPVPACGELEPFEAVADLGNHIVTCHAIPLAGRTRKSNLAPMCEVQPDLQNLLEAQRILNRGKRSLREEDSDAQSERAGSVDTSASTEPVVKARKQTKKRR